MSLARQFAAIGQNATAAFEEEDCKNLRTGLPFRAKIQPISDIELLTELGLDNREVCMIHTRDAAAAKCINDQELISFLDKKWRVVKRMDNPVSLHTDFVCIKGVKGKDDWA